MPKSAIINIERENQLQEIPFKKMALFFDSLYMNERNFYLSKMDIKRSKALDTAEKRAAISEAEWLIEKGIIRLYEFGQEDFSAVRTDDILLNDAQKIDQEVKEKVIFTEEKPTKKDSEYGFFLAGVAALTNDLIFKMEDIRVRIAAAVLGNKNPDQEFVPIVNSFASYQQEKPPCSVAHFILGQLPVPDENTPWEQVLDFRADAEVKRQYYALISWINQVGQKEMPLSHIVDEYNHLYSQYLNQYSLHKMKSHLTTMELIVTAGIDFISSITQQGYVSALKDLLTIRKKQVALLKEEKDIEGRELAYIFSAVQQFK
jgi:hypothetical protein